MVRAARSKHPPRSRSEQQPGRPHRPGSPPAPHLQAGEALDVTGRVEAPGARPANRPEPSPSGEVLGSGRSCNRSESFEASRHRGQDRLDGLEYPSASPSSASPRRGGPLKHVGRIDPAIKPRPCAVRPSSAAGRGAARKGRPATADHRPGAARARRSVSLGGSFMMMPKHYGRRSAGGPGHGESGFPHNVVSKSGRSRPVGP